MKTAFTYLAAALLLCSATTLRAQGSLTPPGAPAPTMKTLDQVEPRTPVDATHTPGDANNLFVISAPGSYYLTGPITGVAGKNGIIVQATNVTIDLRGFAVTGVEGSFDGIRMGESMIRLTLRNGMIKNWGGDGVNEFAGETVASEGTYENLHLVGNAGNGLNLGDKSTVRSCKFTDNLAFGLFASGKSAISNCTATGNGASGIYFGSGSVLDCVSSGNGSSGFENFTEPALVKSCVAFENGDAGFKTDGGATISDCIARANSVPGINAGYFSSVTNCMAKNNGWGIFVGGSCRIVGNMCEGNGDGIYVYADRNEIDGNQVHNGGTGIKVDPGSVSATNNLIVRNMSGGNENNYQIAEDNRTGPVVDITVGPVPGAVGNSAADTTTETNPWANFSYAAPPSAS